MGETKEKEQNPLFTDEASVEVSAENFFVVQAEALRLQNRMDEAIEICKKGLEKTPDLLPGRLLLGRCLLEKEMYAEAKTELEKVAAVIEECLPVYRLLSKIYVHEKRDVDKALEAVRRALYFTSQEVAKKKITPLEMQLTPPIPEKVLPSIAAESETGKRQESADESKGETDRSSIQTDTLAEIYIKQGKLAKALSIYEKILMQDPENGVAREKQEALQGAMKRKREAEIRAKTIAKLEDWLAKVSPTS
jgi:tetratricopeptide (TPR) repeat protein